MLFDSQDARKHDRGTIIVLSWDGLDTTLVERFGLTEAFGPHCTSISTFDNPALGTPHTFEVWPSIITGLPPESHRIRIESSQGVAWQNSLLATGSRLVRPVVPRRVRKRVGQLLQNQGATFDFKRRAYYRANDLSTVFDGRTARAIAVPNYRVPADDDLDIAFDRGAELKRFLQVGMDAAGETTRQLRTSLAQFEERLAAEAGAKLAIARTALQREYDLIFVWLGMLDTIGHVAPVVADEHSDWQERAYRLAADWTRELRADMLDEDTMVCVSDHGLHGGEHTHDAFLGSSAPIVDTAESVLDVRRTIGTITPTSGERTAPPLRDAYRGRETPHPHDGQRQGDAQGVHQRLSDLGYL